MLSAGCPRLLSLKTSHRFNPLGEILLKTRHGIQPSSPSSSFPGEQEWYFVYVKTCHFSELTCIFHGSLAEIPTSCWLHLLLTASPFHFKSQRLLCQGATGTRCASLPRPVVGSATDLLRSKGDAPVDFVTRLFLLLKLLGPGCTFARVPGCFPLLGLYGTCLLCLLFPKGGPETCRDRDLV